MGISHLFKNARCRSWVSRTLGSSFPCRNSGHVVGKWGHFPLEDSMSRQVVRNYIPIKQHTRMSSFQVAKHLLRACESSQYCLLMAHDTTSRLLVDSGSAEGCKCSWNSQKQKQPLQMRCRFHVRHPYVGRKSCYFSLYCL